MMHWTNYLHLVVVLVGALAVLASSSAASPSYYQHQPRQRPVNTELEFVQLIFRNGERRPRPSESYPLDPYYGSSSSTIRYDGRLTELGHYRARRLGLALRRSYSELLRSGLYTYSAEPSGCADSLQTLLRALCGNGDCRAGHEPRIRIVPREIDVVLNSKACSRYGAELDRIRRLPEVQSQLANYDGLYRYITQKTGLSLDGVNVDERLFRLYKLLESQRSMNLTLPSWCPDGVYGLLNEMSFLHYNLESQNDELRRLNGGPFLRRFLDAITATKQKTKIHLYSGAGSNVAAIGRALGKRFPRVPNYGSAIILEKRRQIGVDGRTFVRVLIWTGVSEKMFPVQLKGCLELCPLEIFARIVAEAIPSDAELHCLLGDIVSDIV